ncbi:MAG: hypothetical protein ACKOHM_07180, partial [Spartobacteria bacterium]
MTVTKLPFALLKYSTLVTCLAGLLVLTACDKSERSTSKLDNQKPSTSQKNSNGPDIDPDDAPKDFASITKSISALQSSGAQGGEAIELLGDALEISPEQAAGWAATLPPGLNKDACLEMVFKGWAQEAPDDAARFAKSHLKGVDYRLALASVIEGAASSSPEKAAALLNGEKEP